MELNVFIEKVFAHAKNYDFDDFEIYYEKGGALSLQTYEGEIDDYSDSTDIGVAFRGLVDGKSGSCFTEYLDEETAEFIVKRAYETAKLIENDDDIILYAGSDNYPTINLYNPALETIENQAKIDFVKGLDKQTSEHPLVDKVTGAYYQDFFTECRLLNSKGLDVAYKRNIVVGAVAVQAKDGTEMQSAFSKRFAQDFDELKNHDLTAKAVAKLKDKLGAKSLPTGKYKVVLESEAAADLLAVNFANFNAEVAQKGMSLLKGKVGETIASEKITIIDDPTLDGGLASAPFDGEGVPTCKKELVKQGKFISFLHNLNTAKKDGVETTANASRASYKSVVGVAPSNAYIAAGELSLEEMLAEMKDGVLITELTGLHAGASAVTGDFSLSAKGFKIVGGKRAEALKGIVLSGNFFQLIKSIKAVGNDLDFAKGTILSPSLLVEAMEIAGE